VLSYTSLFLGFIIPAAETESIRYKLARIYTAFFVSGVIHMGGDAMVTGKIIFKAFTFFMLQPFGITIEILVAHLWRQFSGSQDNTSPVHVHDAGNLKTDTKSRGDGDEKSQRKGDRKSEEPIPPVWIRCIGFIWLIFWMAWTAPHVVDPLCVVDVFRDPRADLRRLMR
jgi:hypothetical protein